MRCAGETPASTLDRATIAQRAAAVDPFHMERPGFSLRVGKGPAGAPGASCRTASVTGAGADPSARRDLRTGAADQTGRVNVAGSADEEYSIAVREVWAVSIFVIAPMRLMQKTPPESKSKPRVSRDTG